MSHRATKWAYRDPDARQLLAGPHPPKTPSPSVLSSVLAALAHHANPKSHDNAYPSAPTLARETHLSESAVRKSLSRLRSLGLIEQTGVSESGTFVYRICVDGPVRGTGGAVQEAPVRGTPKETLQGKRPSELPPLDEAVPRDALAGRHTGGAPHAGGPERPANVCVCGTVLATGATSCGCEVFDE